MDIDMSDIASFLPIQIAGGITVDPNAANFQEQLAALTPDQLISFMTSFRKQSAAPVAPAAATVVNTKIAARAPAVYNANSANTTGPQDWLFSVQIFNQANGTDRSKWALTATSYLSPQLQNVMFAQKDVNQISRMSWEDFSELFLQHAGGGKLATDLQVIFECFKVRTDITKKCDTPATLQIIEGLFNKTKQPISDNAKIAFVVRAIHPDLRPAVSYQQDGRAWPDYTAFRQNLISVAPHFDEHCQPRQHRGFSRQQRYEKRHNWQQQRSNGYDHNKPAAPFGVRKPSFKPRFN
eukprot:gene548-821_t